MADREPSKPLRLFIAVPAPEEVRAAAEEVIASLRGSGDVRWVAPHLLHLTLKFLGPTPPEKVEEIRGVLAKTSNNYSPFMVELGDAGAFPNPRKPQTIWLAVRGDVERLRQLADGVDGAVHPLGFEREKRAYKAHLTIGRVKSPRGLAELSRRLAETAARKRRAVSWPVEEIQLVRSDLRPGGPEYTTLERFPLRSG